MRRDVKVIGIGLNKTGTKTLGRYLERWGFRHRTYDSSNTRESASYTLYARGDVEGLLAIVAAHDSVEDWPWPLLYREIDERFPEARFVLTVRRSPEVWYRSLCNMAVRLGPLPLYEKHVYGHAMPHGDRDEDLRCYEEHNEAVAEHFRDRPGKLLTVCWETGDDAATLADFLGLEDVDTAPLHLNPSPTRVYTGDRLWRAHVSRIAYRWIRGPRTPWRRALRAAHDRLRGT
jgi:hypothetical protein